MKRLTKLWCWIVGHNMFNGARINWPSGMTQSGHSECARCGKAFNWQYDN